MERLGTIVHRVLAGLTVTTEEQMAGDREGPRQLAGDRGGGEAHRLASANRHPITSTKRMAKKATGIAVRQNMRR